MTDVGCLCAYSLLTALCRDHCALDGGAPLRKPVMGEMEPAPMKRIHKKYNKGFVRLFFLLFLCVHFWSIFLRLSFTCRGLDLIKCTIYIILSKYTFQTLGILRPVNQSTYTNISFTHNNGISTRLSTKHK